MSVGAQAAVLGRIERAHAAASAAFGGGAAWSARRNAALARLLARGLPDRRSENWRYLDWPEVERRDFSVLPATAAHDGLDSLLLDLPGAFRIVLVDGRFAPELASGPAPAGLRVEGLAAAMARNPEHLTAVLRVPEDDADDRLALLAEAFVEDGAVIRTDAGCAIEPLVYLVHVATGTAGASHSRVLIEARDGSRLRVVEHFVGGGDATLLANVACDVRVGAAAQLEHLRLQQRGAGTAQLETLRVTQQADSRYRHELFLLAGALVRCGLHARLDGSGAEHDMAGLFMVDGQRQADVYTLIEHRAPHTVSRELFRGVAVDRGRGAFNGRIIVREGAQQSDSRQSSRNLILSPLAEINARPQLEILADDVQCSHGATVGSLDPEQFFYLTSRGLDPGTARGLLTFAFCEDVVARVALPALRGHIERLVVGRLPDRDIIREFL